MTTQNGAFDRTRINLALEASIHIALAILLATCLIVALVDNVLKPLLLGRGGGTVPIVVVFLGAIGGFVVLGIIGLFVGAIVLSVGYKLFLAWIDEGAPTNQEA